MSPCRPDKHAPYGVRSAVAVRARQEYSMYSVVLQAGSGIAFSDEHTCMPYFFLRSSTIRSAIYLRRCRFPQALPHCTVTVLHCVAVGSALYASLAQAGNIGHEGRAHRSHLRS